MEKNKLVSIITPCYNGESYIARYLECILSQTYKRIELIIINDGSTDRSDDIIKSYIDKLTIKGIMVKYICQKNLGQAAAVNKGLKIFKGDYLVWQDSDDILSEDYIHDRVEFLDNNPEFGIVCGGIQFVKESNLNEVIGGYERKYPNNNLFYDLIVENNVCFNGYMTRREVILDVIPNRTIYESRAGQNWQLLLPITYKYLCGYIEKSTYTYVIREDSHSHRVIKFDDLMKRTREHEDILVNVINKIDMKKEEKSKLLRIIELKYIRKRLNIASNNGQTEVCYKQIDILKKKNDVKFEDYIVLFISYNIILRKFYNLINKVKNKLIKMKGER